MDGFVAGLVASDAEPTLADEIELFGRFVGSWQVENRYRPGPDAPWRTAARTWVFSWIVGGRAVQDVILGGPPGQEVAGTTVRAYDARIAAWRVHWLGTANGDFCSLIARAHGADGIRQDGVEHLPDGAVPIRWNFSAITPESFTWDGWSSAGGGPWWHEQHMDARRIPATDVSGRTTAALR
jgi:hypothetical protein